VTTDSERWHRIEALFDAVSALPEAEREAWLDNACKDDPSLKAEVLELLQFDGEATGNVRASVRAAADELAEQTATAFIGERIGAFRVCEKIAEGGMGTVFLAERDDGSFEQTVAIKLLSRHLAGADAITRFLEERSILASLEHPNIARLIDGGMLDDGTPYIVMEYVDGVTIDAWCRDQGLGIAGTIELVLRVCDAVRFAHRKLIIHRDIKPANILVDSDGVPKLLDFGIAKLLDTDTDANRALTRSDRRILTPLYASPEQIEGLPVTTAVDVYGLGLLLYRLLTGRLPFVATSNRPRDIEQAILSSPATLPSAAASDSVSSQRRALRGDLDTILLMALRKEPERRYESVAAFAEDLDRYLGKLPIRARKDSFAYKAGKFAQRHRLPLAIAAALVAVAVGLTAYYTQRLRAERETAEETAAFLAGLFEARDPYRRNTDTVTVETLLESGVEKLDDDTSLSPVVRGRLLKTIALVYNNLGNVEKADAMAGEALALLEQSRPENHDDVASALSVLALVRRTQGKYQEATELAERMLRINEHNHGENSMPAAEAAHQLSTLAYYLGDHEAMGRWAKRSLAIRSRLLDENDARMAAGTGNLGLYHWITGDLARARDYYAQTARILDNQAERNDAQYATVLHNLGLLQIDLGETAAAVESYERSIALRRAASGPADPRIPLTIYSLAFACQRLGDFVKADALYEEMLPLQIAVAGRRTDRVAYALTGHGMLLERMGEIDAAREMLEEADAIYDEVLGAEHPDHTATKVGLAYLAMREEEFDRAAGLLDNVLRIRSEAYGAENVRTVRTHTAIGRLNFAKGDYSSARASLKKAIDIMTSNDEADHALVAEALDWLGKTELAAGNADAAVEALRSALAIYRMDSSEDHPDAVESRLVLADALDARGDEEEAAGIREVALPLRDRLRESWNDRPTRR